MIGFVGNDEKCGWLVKEFGYDEVVNYNVLNLFERFVVVCLVGIDIYFDNVGGLFFEIVFD